MEKKTYTYTDSKGNTVSIPVKVNKKLKNKKSGLAKKIATGALILAIGAGTIIGGHHLWNHFNTEDTKPAIVQQYSINDLDEDLRFDPNSKESLIEKATFLIEDAAKCGNELDAEDAVLSVIVANSNEMTPGFMGQLFGEKADQTYTYAKLVDAYLRVGMMEVENMSLATNEDRAFNTENIFANKEDYDYLLNIRNLTTRFNNATDEQEKKQISEELNKIAFDLCTYEAYDISSSAGVLSMLSLDGMRNQTITNTDYTILPNDIRDEMFGNGDYGCHTEATFETADKQILPTHYNYRVNDLKLDSVKAKLDNAILKDGESTILKDIINQVKENTKDVVVANVNVAEEINKKAEENRNIAYEYEVAPGQIKENYSPITENDKIEVNNKGEEVVVVENKNPETVNPENIITQAEAQKELEELQVNAQAEADKGAADGKYDGENGLAKRSTSGKSEHYVSAYNISYDAYKAVYDANQNAIVKEEFISIDTPNHRNDYVRQTPIEKVEEIVINSDNHNDSQIIVEEEFIPLDGLSREELQELKEAAEGEEAIIIENGRIK